MQPQIKEHKEESKNMKCPNCGLINPETAQRCDCGYDFESWRMLESYLPSKKKKEHANDIMPSKGYAGFWKRFAAILIDIFVLAIPGYVIGHIMSLSFASRFDDEITASLSADFMGPFVGIVMGWLYYSIMESSTLQATLGKMALGIAVVDSNGSQLSWGRATARYFGKILSAITMGIGFLLAAFTQKKQALHDMIVGTFVVNK